VHVAGTAARVARSTLAGGTDARAVADAGGDAHLDTSRPAGAANLDRAGDALVRLLEGDRRLALDVLPAAGARLESGPAGWGSGPAEHPVEEIGEGTVGAEQLLELLGIDGAVLDLRTPGSGGRRARAAGLFPGGDLLPVRAVGVVLLPLLRVAEDLMGLVDLLEALDRTRVVGIDVGMVLAGELAEGGMHLLGGRPPGDAKDLVVIAKTRGHRCHQYRFGRAAQTLPPLGGGHTAARGR